MSLLGIELNSTIGNLPEIVDVINTKFSELSAIAPNGLNATQLVINNKVAVRNDDTTPTSVVNIISCAVATLDPSEISWVGDGKPLVMYSLDATDLQILDTTLELKQTTGTPQTTDITATDISIVGGNSATWNDIINNVNPTIDEVLGNGSVSVAKQQTFTSGIDQIQVGIDNTQIFLEDLAVGGSALLARQQLYIESPITTTITHTEITQTSLITNTHNNINSDDNTTTIQGTSLLMLASQPLAPASQQLQITPTDVILTINAGVPTTASWASILAGAGATPTLQAVVNQGNSINNFTAPDTATITSTNNVSGRILELNSDANPTIKMTDYSNSGHYTIFDLDTISLNGVATTWSSIISAGTPNLNTVLSAGNNTSGFNIDFNSNSDIQNCVNGAITNLSVITINGSPYPPVPVAPYGLNGVLTISNDALGLSMTGINDITLSTINGSSYPPSYPTQDFQTTLAYGNSAGSYNINMNSQNIGSCNDVGLVSINSIPFLPAKFSNVFDTFSISSVGSGTTNVYGGSSSPTIPVGNYQITYSVQFDGTVLQSGGQYYSVKAYCWLQGVSVGQVYPYKVNNGYIAGTLMSYNSGYPTCITVTDYIQISTADSFQLGVYQENELGQNCNTCYISAVIQAV